jgi:anti-repressor protein
LGYTNGPKAIKDHCDEGDITKRYTPTSSGEQNMTFVTESGLYSLIFGSKLESAKQFKKWVTSDVLPSIRKHGMYATEATVESMLNDPENAILMLQAYQRERKERLAAQQQVEKLEAQAIEDKPKIIYADAVKGSTSSCLIGELAKMIAQNGYPIGEKRLFQWLRDNHYLCSYGERFNQPYQQYIEQGLFTMKQNVFSVDGEMRTRNTTKVTGKGQIYFINKFIGVPQNP